MYLTLSTRHSPATDLGYLLRKNPQRPQSFPLTFGRAHVFYPEADEHRCTVALLVEIDPVGLVRTRRGPSGEGGLLDQYVNDRPYAASSFLSVALAEVFGTALSGSDSKDRPGLMAQALPFEVVVPALPCRGGEPILRQLFEPLGYQVTCQRLPLDAQFPEWGESSLFRVTLSTTVPLPLLLSHLYVLLPVLDNDKHYWVGDDEVAKLLRHGEGWLANHPARELIARRYLKHRRSLFAEALAQLIQDDGEDPNTEAETQAAEEATVERALSLHEQRLETVLTHLKAHGAKSVLDLGCGEGRLLRRLLQDRQFERILGLDVSHQALEAAAERLHLDRLPEAKRQRIQLLHGSLMYRDERLSGFEAAAVVEVIEHLDPPRLAAFERVLFEAARPALVVLTTPNREYNATWESLPAGQFRHRDHRFEWTRAEFEQWCATIAARFRYAVQRHPVGPEDPLLGAPTQLAVFTLLDSQQVTLHPASPE
ncbi:MAG: 3' terminal RNA ribose 2'-O-methyltransferase Hen1 [Verrucomicrobia bacterium]|nr:3' terminal RNA ribose 2'-O-methyltransferase Hen1 [Verrucomicrobiota bacterium]